MTRTVVIGGVGPTLGASLARRFAVEGDRVALWARSTDYTTALAAELRAETDGDALAVQADVTDPDAVAAAAETVRDELGSVDVYVHNTSVERGWPGPLDGDPEDLLTLLRVPGYGFAVALDELLGDLRSNEGTVIHNTGWFLKWISRRAAKQLTPEGVHVVHVTIDGRVDDETVPEAVPESERADPDVLAEEFLRLVEQDRSAWTFDVEFRPWGDDTFRNHL